MSETISSMERVAVRGRRQPETHKRKMFFATLFVIGPAFAANQRLVGVFFEQFLPQIPVPAILFVFGSAIALAIYDIRRLRTIHAATLFGIAIPAIRN
jgi:hypothetical membrane protein